MNKAYLRAVGIVKFVVSGLTRSAAAVSSDHISIEATGRA